VSGLWTVAIAVGSFVLYLVAYHTYGRYLARRIFRVEPDRLAPAEEFNDGVDYVPSRRELVFGHHFTSIAGTGPIVGPAVGVVWGWVPALIWVLVGSIVMGAVHDFGSLIVSMRNKGRTIADLAGDVVTPRVRVLFLIVVLVGLWIVLAVFGLVIAVVFKVFPSSVVPVFLQIPIAVGLGIWMRRGGSLLAGTVVAVVLMYATIAWSASIGWATASNPGGVEIIPAAITSVMSPVAFWTLVLLVYVFVASVLPVQTLLQPRDYINSWQLLIAMGLLLVGLLVAHPPIVGDAVNFRPKAGAGGLSAPPFVPFLFVTIACGAISGFHCLVASGCSSRQLRSEADAQYVGYGAMLTEGFLATLVILACVAGIGLGTQWETFAAVPKVPAYSVSIPQLSPPEIVHATGREAWLHHYATWGGGAGLGDKLAPFVRGSANMIEAVGLSHALAVAIMGVFVASFAATTLDSATRLQRYVIAELAGAGKLSGEAICASCGYSVAGLPSATCPECGSDQRTVKERRPTNVFCALIANRYVATGIAVLTAGLLALSDGLRVDRTYSGPITLQQGRTTTQIPANGTMEIKGVPVGAEHGSIEGADSMSMEGTIRITADYSDAPIRLTGSESPAMSAEEEPAPAAGTPLSEQLPKPTRSRMRVDLTKAGMGGLILWPVFGATNQLLGGLALLVVTVWLVKKGRPAWVTALPMVFMLAMTGWAIALLAKGFADAPGKTHLLVVSLLMLGLEVWIVFEAAVLLVRGRANRIEKN